MTLFCFSSFILTLPWPRFIDGTQSWSFGVNSGDAEPSKSKGIDQKITQGSIKKLYCIYIYISTTIIGTTGDKIIIN